MLVSARLFLYWTALNSCTGRKRKKEGRKRERARERDREIEIKREKERKREREKERKRAKADELGLLELKAKLVSAGLLMYWIAVNSCT